MRRPRFRRPDDGGPSSGAGAGAAAASGRAAGGVPLAFGGDHGGATFGVFRLRNLYATHTATAISRQPPSTEPSAIPATVVGCHVRVRKPRVGDVGRRGPAAAAAATVGARGSGGGAEGSSSR